MLFTRCLPRFFNGLADFNARLGNRYGLGFTVSGLSPDKKRLALLGAQRQSAYTATSDGKRRNESEAMKPRKDSADRGAGSGCMARLVRFSVFIHGCFHGVWQSEE